ncbi:hypothetical protein [Streptomyces sp. NBC_00286]|uniref:hypothetical protein n=1 Tax=Streptomyces sp. NBC_00286 TaxID=2975701 RepID=UPI002E2A3693|nr:hypothetical protein [Streptomyces sp. NBC_00286]
MAVELGAALVEVPDEVAVGVVNELQAVEEPLGFGLCLGDGPAERRRMCFSFALSIGVHLVHGLGQQFSPVHAENPVGQEITEPLEHACLRHPDARRVIRSSVRLLRRADVVVDPLAGLAVEAALALCAEDEAA